MTVAKLQDPAGHFNIVEAAAPVEFLLERVRGPSSTINQTEVSQPLCVVPCGANRRYHSLWVSVATPRPWGLRFRPRFPGIS